MASASVPKLSLGSHFPISVISVFTIRNVSSSVIVLVILGMFAVLDGVYNKGDHTQERREIWSLATAVLFVMLLVGCLWMSVQYIMLVGIYKMNIFSSQVGNPNHIDASEMPKTVVAGEIWDTRYMNTKTFHVIQKRAWMLVPHLVLTACTTLGISVAGLVNMQTGIKTVAVIAGFIWIQTYFWFHVFSYYQELKYRALAIAPEPTAV